MTAAANQQCSATAYLKIGAEDHSRQYLRSSCFIGQASFDLWQKLPEQISTTSCATDAAIEQP